MATYDLTDFLEDDSLVLEGIRSTKYPKGKAYRFSSPPAKVGLWLKNLVEFGLRANIARITGQDPAPSAGDTSKLLLDDDEEVDLYRRVMGDTFDELIADGVPWSNVQKVFYLLLRHYGTGNPISEQIKPDGHPEAAGPVNRAGRRAQQKRAGSSSSRASSGTRARTPSRTSTRSSRTSGQDGTQKPA